MLAMLYGVYAAGVAVVRPSAAPALPKEERQLAPLALTRQVLVALLPPLALIVLVLGGIFAGVATPTEAGALGALGSIVLALLSKRLTWHALRETVRYTTRLTSMVIFLLIGATAFSLVFRGVGGDGWIESLLTELPGGEIGFLVIANLVIFVLGFFIDFFEIAFIILPLLLPAARALDIDLVWFGVMIGMNLQTSFLTPPFGFAIFYLRGVAPPEISTGTMYRAVVPFIVIQLVGLALICLFPELITALLPG
jgi:tripartite ATP-independent transporter DctM subunit